MAMEYIFLDTCVGMAFEALITSHRRTLSRVWQALLMLLRTRQGHVLAEAVGHAPQLLPHYAHIEAAHGMSP